MEAKALFLSSAACLLADTAPATAAHLMLQSQATAAEHGLSLPRSEDRSVCKACGTITILERSGHNPIKKNNDKSQNASPRTQKSKKTLPSTEEYLVLKCHACRRTTRTHTPREELSRLAKSSEAGLAVPSSTSVPMSATSKDRNKARKEKAKDLKHGALQAMLAKSREDTRRSSGFGLDLMDFMKTT